MNSNNGFLKPLCVAVSAVALDQYVMKETDFKRSLVFGSAVGVGSYLSEIVAPHITPDIPQLNFASSMYNEKKVGERIVELASSAVSVFAVNKYLLRNDIYKDEMMIRMGLIVASDVIGTYASEYIDSKPLTYLE